MEKRIRLTDEQFDDLLFALSSGMTIENWVYCAFPEVYGKEWYMDKGGVLVIKQ